MSLSEVLPGFQPEPGQPPQRRRNAARQQRKRKKQKRRRSLLAIVVTFVVVVGGIGGAYLGLKPLISQLTEPNDYTGAGAGAGTATVKIPEGASGRDIARVLTTAGVTKTPVAFLDAAKADTRAARIQPGTYELHRQMSAASALALLLDPDARSQITLTVPEGRRATEIYAELQEKLGFSRAQLTAAAKSDELGLPAAARGRVEGYLFPATYDFQPDVTPLQALQAMVERGKATFDDLGIPGSQLHDVVVKASIVQAEAGRKEYMGKVARVLDNRLDDGMKLQLDSTVSYATGKFEITTSSKDRSSTSGYNTYKHAGLPPGPISNPGEDALKAALEPTAGKWLFFVTVNPKTGETKFAETPEQHGEYVKEFQAWLRANP